MGRTAMSEADGFTKRVPLVIGGLGIAAGIGLGLWPQRDPTAQTVASTAVPTPTQTADEADVASHEDYQPDLSGPRIGELIVDGASMAHGLVMVGGRLVWLLTDGATLGSARADGGSPVVVFSSDDADAFGGSLASDGNSVWWSVESAGDEPEAIYQARSAQLSAVLEDAQPVLRGTSPDHLSTLGPDELAWSDLGRIMRITQGKTQTLAIRSKRIVALTAGSDALFWIEAPYQGGGDQQLLTLPLAGGEANVRAAKLAERDRDLLIAIGQTIFWAESEGELHTLRALDEGASSPRHVTATGLITAIAHDARQIAWAEAHGDDDAPTSLLRSLPLTGTPPRSVKGIPTRIGTVAGHVTAIALDEAHVFWSSPRGIERHPR